MVRFEKPAKLIRSLRDRKRRLHYFSKSIVGHILERGDRVEHF